MTVVETAAEDVIVDFAPAETRDESIRLRRSTDVAIMGLIVAVQIGWVAAGAYAAYLFVV